MAKPTAILAGIAILILLAVIGGATLLGGLFLFQQPSPTSAPTEKIIPKKYLRRAHLINPAFKYADVQLEVVATNNGNNANGVSLICRYSDRGWIEFTVSNNQTYSIYVFDSSGETLQGGVFGSKKILSGKEMNVYAATCKGDELSLSVNGTHLNTIKINHDFPEGNIGIGFSALVICRSMWSLSR